MLPPPPPGWRRRTVTVMDGLRPRHRDAPDSNGTDDSNAAPADLRHHFIRRVCPARPGGRRPWCASQSASAVAGEAHGKAGAAPGEPPHGERGRRGGASGTPPSKPDPGIRLPSLAHGASTAWPPMALRPGRNSGTDFSVRCGLNSIAFLPKAFLRFDVDPQFVPVFGNVAF